MNTNDLEQIAQARYEYTVAKKNLKERIDQYLIFAYDNGLFRAGPELISFLNGWEDEFLIVEDLYHNPVRADRVKMLDRARQCYKTAMNIWFEEYQTVCQIRDSSDV